MTRIIGIDPGKNGGIAVARQEAGSWAMQAVRMPETERDLWDALVGLDPAVAYIEKVGPTSQMGVTSAFKFGRGAGLVHMAAIAAGLRIELVTPQRWQAALHLPKIGGGAGKNDTAKKNRNKAKAQELRPEMRITHAIADAILLCEYGILQCSK